MTVTAPDLRSRFLGCFLGGAIGDALGGPIEFLSLDEIRRRWPPGGPASYVPMNGRKGVITDDTQMTLWTAEGLIRADNRFASRGIAHAPGVVWGAYRRWLRTQEPSRRLRDGHTEEHDGWLLSRPEVFDIQAPGNTCLSALRGGVPGGIKPEDYPSSSTHSEWGALNDSKGCGGVMRVAPVGLVASDPFTLAAEIAALTHSHPTGYLAAGALARIVNEIIRGRSIGDAVHRAEPELQEWPRHDEVLSALRESTRLAAQTREATPEAVESLGTGWVAEEALAIAVYCALTADDVRSALALAASHSGDSDSTAAITGNILGAARGVEALPDDLLADLELRTLIEEVANDFADHFVDGRSGHDLDKYPPN